MDQLLTDVTHSVKRVISEIRSSQFAFWLRLGVARLPRVIHGFTPVNRSVSNSFFAEDVFPWGPNLAGSFSLFRFSCSESGSSDHPPATALPAHHCFHGVTRLVSL